VNGSAIPGQLFISQEGRAGALVNLQVLRVLNSTDQGSRQGRPVSTA
jgi:hypothetical protein